VGKGSLTSFIARLGGGREECFDEKVQARTPNNYLQCQDPLRDGSGQELRLGRLVGRPLHPDIAYDMVLRVEDLALELEREAESEEAEPVLWREKPYPKVER
jgi:hypothetical protein